MDTLTRASVVADAARRRDEEVLFATQQLYDERVPHPHYPLFPTIRDHPDLYGQHRYSAVHWWDLSEVTRAFLQCLGAFPLHGLFTGHQVVSVVNAAIASLP